MKEIILFNSIVFLIVGGICIVIGLDLKNWQSWLVGLYGFITGWLFKFIVKDGSSSWQLGLMFAIMVMFGGAVMRQHRLYFRKAGEKWLTKYGKDKQNSLLTRLIRRALGK